MDETNRDEALRAKEIAERKFNLRDLKAARKFALKAEKLYPSLDGVSQLLSTIEVYQASENRYGGESDWYGVLGLAAFSDEETVKKQYRKLALQLHPDKNKSVGAEGAFKLISEALSVLSDTSRKSTYDQKRKSYGSSTPSTNNGVSSSSSTRSRKRAASGSGSGSGSTLRTGVDTFWTSCNRCRMQYEYLRIYLNHNLLCPNCHNAFMAVETGFPCNGSGSSSNSNFGYSGTNSRNYDSYGNNNSNFQWQNNQQHKSTSSRGRRKHEETTYEFNYDYNYNNSNNVNNYNYNYSSGGSANVYPQEKPTKRLGRPPKRRRYSYGEANNGSERQFPEPERPNGFSQAGNDNTSNSNNNVGANNSYNYNFSSRMPAKRNNFRDISQIDIRAMLMEKTKNLVEKKLEEFRISNSNSKENEESSPVEDDASDGKNNEPAEVNPTDPRKVVKVVRQPVSIDVPDPDFYDFDKDRTEKAFDGDQVWATYDSEDGMPRLYAMVQKIITKKPFTIRMSFLNSKSNLELGPINWVGSGFTKTCGDFRVGRYQVTDTVNIFSHRVKFEKGPRGIVKIVPRKGETWAVYKNWSPEWNELTPEDVIYKYEIVEIVTDYDVENGVEVVPMVKVAGFKAVFHRHMDPKEVRRIPREEMFRFSHGIPSRILTGEEAANSPKGCHELDPAATPVDLLQVISDDVTVESAD
ncbi:DNAJ heat shock N-terminal domain-containing protein [Rhynchospora pubera]|uniref:DNAJ heat shock N-terminal domain-containing protein n=1 Tax=Rhynchospora pubera TaxID=906938 RepID=A0AAV8FCE4_9POAL|nr:DNAJ heat shock N-terminal domain-containing protein [Rhynchospora pubera]